MKKANNILKNVDKRAFYFGMMVSSIILILGISVCYAVNYTSITSIHLLIMYAQNAATRLSPTITNQMKCNILEFKWVILYMKNIKFQMEDVLSVDMKKFR